MGYGTDESEMIIELPVLTDTIECLLVFSGTESDYSTYGSNTQLITDLSTLLSVDSANIEVVSAIDSVTVETTSFTIVYNIKVYDQDSYTSDELQST